MKNFFIHLNTFLLEYIENNVHPIGLFTILFFISMSKSTIALSSVLPPASIMLVTVITISLSKLGIPLIWLAITLGATSGSIISYHLGNQITQKKLFLRFFSRYQSNIDYAYNKLKHQGMIILFISRFIAVLRYTLPLVTGMLLISKTKVYSVSLLSAAIWAKILILSVNGILSMLSPLHH